VVANADGFSADPLAMPLARVPPHIRRLPPQSNPDDVGVGRLYLFSLAGAALSEGLGKLA